jgi:hypothetical protein
MRDELEKLDGQRELFVGLFVREGLKNSFKGTPLTTILLKDVRRLSDGKIMCDHLWLNKTKSFAALELTIGTEIQFAARVKKYSKGYQGKKRNLKKEVKHDFKLSHPTQVQIFESIKKQNKRIESRLIIRKAKKEEQ